MHDFTIKQGDTRPSIEAQLLDDQRQPRDLQTAQAVRFHMRDTDTQEVVVDAAAVIVNEDDAVVAYEWQDGDTETLGRHAAEFEVQYSDGKETFPNNGDIEVYIEEDIA